MKLGYISTCMTALALASSLAPASAETLDKITVGYFLEWPMPFQFAKANGTYDAELGLQVNWVSFESGAAMAAAMASGDVDISVSQGVPSVVVANSAGQDLQIVDIAVSYADNQNCVVQQSLGIDKTNADKLAGKKVAVPIGTVTHYGFLKLMEHFNVDASALEIVDMNSSDGSAAFAQGSVDVFCGWGGSLRRALETGNVLLTGKEKEAVGILEFDGITAPANFIAEHSDIVSKFLKVTDDANTMWSEGSKASEMLPVIAKDAGMDEQAASESLATFEFPTIEEKLGASWLGGGVQSYLKGVADVFATTGNIPNVLPSYDAAVNAAPLTAAGAI
ncbi:MAG: ABC transporter substrate-binding protein [Rhodobacteraceae bacterium]|nr:ABC transporter substrate-binding protein [Paracoccaceae bacterium]